MTKPKKVTKRRGGQSSSKAMLAGTVTAWAWECDFGLCKWAEPDKERLQWNKPSPEARMVAVRLIKESEYRRLKRMMTANSYLDDKSRAAALERLEYVILDHCCTCGAGTNAKREHAPHCVAVHMID